MEKRGIRSGDSRSVDMGSVDMIMRLWLGGLGREDMGRGAWVGVWDIGLGYLIRGICRRIL